MGDQRVLGHSLGSLRNVPEPSASSFESIQVPRLWLPPAALQGLQ